MSPTEARFHHGFYEVHLPVTDLDRAVAFYVDKLGFEQGFHRPDRSGALLLYEAAEGRSMLGLFVVESIEHRTAAEYHVSLRVDEEDIDRMIPWLEERGIEPIHPPTFSVEGPVTEPMVHGWMPAAAVFFQDPDGHLLELIADLSDPPRADFLYRPLSEWRALVGAAGTA